MEICCGLIQKSLERIVTCQKNLASEVFFFFFISQNHKFLMCLCLHFKAEHNVNHDFPQSTQAECLQKASRYQTDAPPPPPPPSAALEGTIIPVSFNGKFHGNHPMSYFRTSSRDLHGNLPYDTTEQHSNKATTC